MCPQASAALCPARLTYTRGDLLRLRHFSPPLSRRVRRTAWFLRIPLARVPTSSWLHQDYRVVPSQLIPPDRCQKSAANQPPSTVPTAAQRRDRHRVSPPRPLRFGFLNIRSLANKVDDLLEVRRDLLVDVLLLAETWHDSDSVCLSRLRSLHFEVLDRPRPRCRTDTLATNHGGVAAISSPGVHLTRLCTGPDPSTFEHLCFRVFSKSTACVVFLVYRTGPVTSLFFSEFSSVLDRLVSFSDPITVVGVWFVLGRTTLPRTEARSRWPLET